MDFAANSLKACRISSIQIKNSRPRLLQLESNREVMEDYE